MLVAIGIYTFRNAIANATFVLSLSFNSSTDTGDAGAAKRRQEAIEALTKIEIEFAQLRDKMYLEKMEEVAKERWQIENGEFAIYRVMHFIFHMF